MLRVVMKSFDAEVPLQTGDIVDIAGWPNGAELEKLGYIGPTDAKAATVDANTPRSARSPKKKSSNKTTERPLAKVRRSALASRPRVFR